MLRLPFLVALLAGFVPSQSRIDFDREVRPILADKCFPCHGPDASHRRGELRLDRREDALAPRGERSPAVVPGDPETSLLVRRILHGDPKRRMPPPSTQKPLDARERETLVRWVAAGAPWQEHWAFVSPRAPTLPQVSDPAWRRSGIDRLVFARLEREGLRPAQPAAAATLLRRVSLDLTGLPPTPAEVTAFLADDRPDRYERAVDRLLASPGYGEHLARYWLDAARYGDTHGLHLDNYREMWPYRDWVIRAFQRNLPFDRFLIEQLAGDLLPEATLDQRIASGFNRCHVTTSEGGSIEAEVYTRNVIDRVSTVGTVFLGLSVGCAVCHDHKFDPISQREFYQLFAFFNNLDGKPLDGNAKRHAPVVRVPNSDQAAQLARLDAEAAAVRAETGRILAGIDYREPAPEAVAAPSEEPVDCVWIDDSPPVGSRRQGDGPKTWRFVAGGRNGHPTAQSGALVLRRKGRGLNQDVCSGSPPLRVHSGDRLFASVWLDPQDPPKSVQLQFHSGNWNHRVRWGGPAHGPGMGGGGDHVAGPIPATGAWVRLEVGIDQVGLQDGASIDGWAFTQVDGTVYWDRAGIHTKTPPDTRALRSLAAWEASAGADKTLPKTIRTALALAPEKRTPAQTQALRDHYLRHVHAGSRGLFAAVAAREETLARERQRLDQAIPTTLVMRERAKPRKAFLLRRGRYDLHGDQVERRTPAVLPAMAADLPRDRLGLARWLTDPEHPLTARVTVNRFWQQLFGVGLVKTSEDFGNQGERPSHPELLDWLATRFVADGWDVRQLMRRMVLSATYRQDSKLTPELRRRDPDNRLLARGPRFRLDAETLRDQALALSGLLVTTVGGPGVKPPQPAGLWQAVGYVGSNTARFQADTDPAKTHRRSIYTFWKRTSPPPQLTTFDAPSREECRVRRERTNTPLQALLLMNDPQYVEAARRLAGRVMAEGGTTDRERVRWALRLATARTPRPADVADLLGLLEAERRRFLADPKAARAFAAVDEGPAAEAAAWTTVANLILNLDEVITKD